ncbi:hypothetical protein D3C87_1242010 [compost metagenome]
MNWLAAEVALVPPAAVTRTSTVPVPAGGVALIWVVLSNVKLAAAAPPKVTFVAPEKFVPPMVTLVPPADGPLFGEIDVTVGAGT